MTRAKISNRNKSKERKGYKGSNNRTLLLAIILTTTPSLLSTKKSYRFRQSFRFGCKFHPADPTPNKPTCLPKIRPKSLIENCDYHEEGICMLCNNGFFLSFPEIKCKPCFRGCKHCDGSLEKDCFKLDEGYRFNLNKVRIEGCYPTDEDVYASGGCHDCDNKLGLCTTCQPGYANRMKLLKPVTQIEKEQLNRKINERKKNDPDFEEKIKEMQEKGKTVKGNVGKMHPDEDLDQELNEFSKRKDNSGFHYLECVKCKDGCNHCYHDQICTECQHEYELIGGTCVKLSPEALKRKEGKCKKASKDGRWCFDCPEGQSFSFRKRKCVTCPDDCTSCHTSAFCTSCKQGFKINQNSGVCEPCKVAGCLNCHESLRSCLECMKGFYFSLTTHRCEKCHSSCAECSGPKKKDCMSCRLKHMKVEYVYDDVPSALAQKKLHDFNMRHPEFTNQHMLKGFLLHTESDTFCQEYCTDHDELHKRQGVFDGDHEFTNDCPTIYGPHPQDMFGNTDELKFEYGGHHTDDEAEAEYHHDIHKRQQRENLKKHVEKELTKGEERGHHDAVNRHHIGRKEYEKLVRDVEDKRRTIVNAEDKQRVKDLKDKIPNTETDEERRVNEHAKNKISKHPKLEVYEEGPNKGHVKHDQVDRRRMGREGSPPFVQMRKKRVADSSGDL